MEGIRMPLSRLVKSRRMQIRHHIDHLTARGDYLTSRAAGGWALSRTGRRVRVEIWSRERCIAETIAGEARPDLAALLPDARASLHSGFNLAFTLPANGLFTEVRVRMVAEDEQGRAIESLDAAAAQFLTDDGLQAIKAKSAAAARGRFLSGCTGAFWRRDGGIPVLADAPIRKLLAGI